MSQEVTVLNAEIIASLVLNGDLSKLDQNQKVAYYRQFCERLGLDPISQPFKLMKFQGKEVLYCDRGGAQQLNRLHSISHTIKSRESINECCVVTAQAVDMTGRHTESTGAVSIAGLKGEALCNAMMKAETKAKRRATLDLLGLGMLDETEAETIPNVETETINIPEKAKMDLTPTHEKWQGVINYIQETGRIEDVENKYTISPENKALLINIINTPA